MSNQVKVAPDLKSGQLDQLDKLDTMSAKIRYLDAEGFARADISRILTKTEGRNVRYQWVRNVLTQVVTKK